jgi:energy-converting hydrogenase A subunit M
MNTNDEEIKKTDEETKTSEEEVSTSEEANTSEEEINNSKELNTSEEEEEESTSEEKNTPEEEIDSSEDLISPDIEKEFEEEIKFQKEAQATSEEELRLRMKKRILASFKWQEDIIIPFSKELEITSDELEEILMKRLDMSSLEAIQPRFESSLLRCTKERIHSDLKLCLLCDVMDLLTEEEAEDIKTKISIKIFKEDKNYEKALEEGRKELVEYLKR